MRNDFLINTKSACILSDEVVVATAKRTWIHQPNPAGSSDRTASKISDADRIAQTQKLLDRAIAYAWHTVKSDRRPPKLTPIRWVWRMAGAYHSSRHTSRLMEEAAQRFAASGRTNLAEWAAQKAKEEAGHDRLALLDIQSMGYEAEAVVQALVPSAATALVNYFTQSVQAPDSIGCLGYCYTLERLAMGIGEKYIQGVEKLLPQEIKATRCLYVHSRLGSEEEHMKGTVKMIASLTHEHFVPVVSACYKTALICFSPPKEGYVLEEELQNILRPLKSVI
ncbi:hypothetical protein [Nostoc sp. WHI]|uniref:hypothetical protein n=1 Tax=Nostoc sp. WHI TaxID=2650611 RepID=UPI0018C5B1F8|nr:hypothetical protein [Nostoc sp. WHI]MBG1270913.1 hypothetical protein [Nostoc sp. WHI]